MVMLCIIFSFGLPCGIADLAASTVSNAVPHRQLLRNDIFRVALGFAFSFRFGSLSLGLRLKASTPQVDGTSRPNRAAILQRRIFDLDFRSIRVKP